MRSYFFISWAHVLIIGKDCAVEGACQANEAGVTHDALLLSMFLLPRL